MRKAKIICTIGPTSSSQDVIVDLLKAGMDIARTNFSYGSREDHKRLISSVREASRKTGCLVALLQDLQGPKIRVGRLKKESIYLREGASLTITSREIEGDETRIWVSYEYLSRDAKKGDRILLDDGLIELKVIGVRGEDVLCEVIDGGVLRAYRGVNLPGIHIRAPSLTEKDVDDLKFGITQRVDYVAVSFVRSSRDVLAAKEIIASLGEDIPVIAKLEKPEALKNLDSILEVSDAVMVARGDLGVEMPPQEVPILQKEIVEKANERKIPVIIATQMLQSMMEEPRPTRAEASDVANAVLDGADALMLSGETAMGKYPVQAVRMMDRIIRVAEERGIRRIRMPFHRKGEVSSFSDAISQAATRAAEEVGANAIVAFTQSGATARLVAKAKPRVPIIAFTPDKRVSLRMCLYWGVIPRIMRPIENTDEMIMEVDRVLTKEKLAHPGDTLVIVSGAPIFKKGTTDLMKLHRVSL